MSEFLEGNQEPFTVFTQWVKEARAAGDWWDGAMSLATSSAHGAVSSRMVLLKKFSAQDGFHFFTHYASHKGQDLHQHPRAALLFYWAKLERQVRIEGEVSQLARAESEAYFRTRSRTSQIGAWASAQSKPLASRQEFLASVRQIEQKFSGQSVLPCPPGWGGFRLAPHLVEFWQAEPSRWHWRRQFVRIAAGGAWQSELLHP